MKKISIVLPCLNEEKNLPLIVPEIIRNVPKSYDYEIICVDDGSTDSTPNVIEKLSKNKKIKAVVLYKRFGHQTALKTGIHYASGDAVITMDSDFQHPPALISKMISLWEKGYDLVLARKRFDRTIPYFQKFNRFLAYNIWDKLTDGILTPGVSDFRLFSKKISEYIKRSKEREIFLRGMVSLGAKKSVIIPYTVGRRKFGKSSYSISMFVNMFINGFVSFSPKPLRLASFFGLFLALFTTLFLVYDILSALVLGRRIIEGWVTVVFLVLVLNGFVIFYLGILGEYIGVIFREIKKRPRYIIEKKFNL